MPVLVFKRQYLILCSTQQKHKAEGSVLKPLLAYNKCQSSQRRDKRKRKMAVNLKDWYGKAQVRCQKINTGRDYQ